MNIITFDLKEIMKLIVIEKRGAPNSRPYSDWIDDIPDTPEHGLNLVGDQGIYLMANTKDQEKNPETDRFNIAYAEECNPETMEVDELYDAKRDIFGGDDGVQFWPIKAILKWIHRGKYQIKITKTEMELI